MVGRDEPRAEMIRLVRGYPRMQGLAFLPFWAIYFAAGVAQAAGWIDPVDSLLVLPVGLAGVFLGRAYYRRTFGIIRPAPDPAVRMLKGVGVFLGLVLVLVVQSHIARTWPAIRFDLLTVLLLVACVYRAWSDGSDGPHWFIASMLVLGAVLVGPAWTKEAPWLDGMHQTLIGLAMSIGALGDHRALVRRFERLSAMMAERGPAHA